MLRIRLIQYQQVELAAILLKILNSKTEVKKHKNFQTGKTKVNTKGKELV